MSRRSGLATVFEGVGIALHDLRVDKPRASLAVLGVAAGVFVVVAVSSVVRGINASVERDLRSAGPASFYVYRVPIPPAGACDDAGVRCVWRRNPPITVDDAAAIARLESVEAVAAHVAATATVTHEHRVVRGAGLDAYSVRWPAVDGGGINPGRPFTQAESEVGARVVVVSATMAALLFGDADPLDEVVEVNGVPFRVIGVHHYTAGFIGKPGSSTRGDAPRAIVPLEAARRHLGVSDRWLDLTVRPRPSAAQTEALHDVGTLLRVRRGLRPGSADNFAVLTADRLLEVYDGFLGVVVVGMVALSAVALSAGGVGVVAIMTISVTERAREIGVQRALGATRRIILWQLLVEAVTLACVGAIPGLLVGTTAALLIDRLTAIPTSIPPGSLVAALVASGVTGALFGATPAARGARLRPGDVLRRG